MNVSVYACPAERVPLFHSPSGLGELPLVVVCPTPSRLVQRTDVPTLSVRLAGTKAKPCMLTFTNTGTHVGVGVPVLVGVPVFVGVPV